MLEEDRPSPLLSLALQRRCDDLLEFALPLIDVAPDPPFPEVLRLIRKRPGEGQEGERRITRLFEQALPRGTGSRAGDAGGLNDRRVDDLFGRLVPAPMLLAAVPAADVARELFQLLQEPSAGLRQADLLAD